MIPEIIEEVRNNSMLSINKVSSPKLVRDVVWHPSWITIVENVNPAYRNIVRTIKEML